MKNLQFIYPKKSISRLVIFLLIINSFMFTDGLFNQSYAAPSINEMNINTTDNEVSVYGNGDGNGIALSDKPFRYTIGNSQSEWVRDTSNMTITDTLTTGTLSNTSVVNNALQLSPVGGVYLNGYPYKSVITIDHTKIDTTLTNFPLTVYLNSSNFDFSKAKADGTDIRFTDASLNTLKFEREEYSATNGKAVYNVLIPIVSNTADTQIYMWYGNPNAYNTSIEAWQDQTGKQITYNGNVKLVTGIQTGKRVASFDAGNNFFRVPGSSAFDFGSGDMTIEFIVNRYNTSSNGTVFCSVGDRQWNHVIGGWNVGFDGGGTGKVFINWNAGLSGLTREWGSLISASVIPLNTPTHVAFVKRSNVMYCYINGVLDNSTAWNHVMTYSGDPLIGRHDGRGADLNGLALQAYLLGLKISKGRAVYTANFTPPTSFSIDGADVVFCTNFDTIYDSNYAMVQHMGDTLVDATGNGNNGAATGTTVVNTDYGMTRNFNGSSDYISFNSKVTPLGAKSILALSKWNGIKKFLISNGAGTPSFNGFNLYSDGSSEINPSVLSLPPTANPSTSDFTALGFTWDGTTAINTCKNFLNGTPNGISTASSTETSTPSFNLFIGRRGSDMASAFIGQLSEVRMSNIARSDAWVKAEALSIKNELKPCETGTRESTVYDVSGYVSGSRVQWAESKPTGTNIIVESNVSIDGGSSWLGWKTCANGGSVPDLTSTNSSNARLKLRQTLSTNSGGVTPSLSNCVITVNFSKYVHKLTNAGPNRKYTVKFDIKDANGNVTSTTRDIYTKAQSPAFTISGATDHSVDLLFSDANPATTEYQIMCSGEYVNSSGVLTSVPTWITLKNKCITILGLNIGTMYNLTAKARNGAEEETNIGEINSATQGVPVPTGSAILAATALNNSVTLGWNEIPNSLSYELELDGVIKNVGLNTSYIHKDLMTNTQHVYRVRGRNKGGFSAWSDFVTVTTMNNLPLIPTNVVAKASNDSITVYWSSAQDALTYTVEIDDAEITDVSKNSASLFGLEPETAYTYRVKACNLAGESEWSETGTIVTTYLNTPKITFKEKDSNQLKIGWEKIEGATSYQIALDADEGFRILYASDLEEFTTGTSITYTHDNLPNKTPHVYRVRAVCPEGTSAWSDAVTLETLAQRPDVPANFRGKCSDNFITLTWDAIQDAIGYDLEVDGVVIENDNTPQYQYKGLDQYTEHTYRVRSVTKEIQSYWSKLVRLWTSGGIPDEPRNVVITNSRGIATLAWDPTPGAQNYDIEADGKIYSISEDTFVYNNINLITSSASIYKETAYRLRAGNDVGKSDWTGYYVNNAIMAKVQKGKELDLGLTASNIMDFSKYTLYVNYNDKALTVTDLCAYSVEKELGPGMVEGHDIEIVSFTPGHIVFRINKIIDEGYLWTGIINNIKFTGNATGGSTITYTAQCSKD